MKIKDYDYYNEFDYEEQINDERKGELITKIKDNIVGIVNVLFDNKVVHTENIYLKVIKDKKEEGFFKKLLGWFK